MRWIALGKKLFLCLVILVLRALQRRPDGNSAKRECAGCEGSRVILPALLLTLDKYSSWRVGRVVPMIRSAVRTTLRSLLWSDFGSWAEPDSYWRAEDRFKDGRVELFQQLLWHVKLPQLAKEVQPLLGLFYNGVYVIVPLQVLGDGGAQEPEWLHCSHSAVHDGEWGESRGVSPEVHDHLHCFECVKLQVVKTAPDSQLLNLLSVSRLVTVLDEADQFGVVCKLQEFDRGVFRCAVVGVQGEEQWGENTALRSSSADGTGAGWEFFCIEFALSSRI